jgi:hypothetical protein
MSQRFRSLLVLLIGGAALVFVADIIANTGLLRPRDFLEYWSAGRVNLRSGNPYHPAELLAEQKLADPERKEAVMMWNPPPALAVYMPVGAIPPGWATLLWVGLQLAAVFVACDLLWRTYCPAHRWFAIAVGFSFVGTWWLVSYGQNTGFLLLGLAGFLHFRQKDKPLVAGAFAALTALKPHLLACFGVLLLADAFTRRGAKSLASGVAAIAIALGVALATNPNVIAQFIEAARHPAQGATPLSDWKLPVAAYWLRKSLAPDQFWVQFVPCAVACIGFLAYRVGKTTWDWARELPLVVAVSLIATPYGGWIFDLPVLLVPVVWAAARLVAAQKWPLALVFLLGQAAITAASFEWAGRASGEHEYRGLHEYWWVAPASLAMCLVACGIKEKATQGEPGA